MTKLGRVIVSSKFEDLIFAEKLWPNVRVVGLPEKTLTWQTL
jgi:hypothetical protein